MYFKIMRHFWDYCFKNPDKINTNHIAIFCFIVEHCNRLGWKEKFGLPTMMVCEAVGIKSVNTYSKAFNELIDMGLIQLIQKSKNQWSANVIAISIFEEASDTPLDTARIKHMRQHLQSTCDSTDTIIRHNTNNPIQEDGEEVKASPTPSFDRLDILERIKEKIPGITPNQYAKELHESNPAIIKQVISITMDFLDYGKGESMWYYEDKLINGKFSVYRKGKATVAKIIDDIIDLHNRGHILIKRAK